MIDVGIVGASGYGGGELLRLLLRHPGARVRVAVSETYAGKPIEASFPALAGLTDLTFTSNVEEAERCQAVFLAQDNGKAMLLAPKLLSAGCRVIDLSADFRFNDTAIYDTWYKGPHACPSIAEEAVYGLPELNRERIRTANVVGNPGCYPTATILGLVPLLKGGLIDPTSLVIDGKSGVSGAGRAKFSLEFHFAEVNESVSAYKLAGTHRHTPEIEQAIGALTGTAVPVTFTPHLIPITRGILVTSVAALREPLTTRELVETYVETYSGEPFITILNDGALPATKHAVGTNRCHIGLAVDPRTNRVTVVSAIDNLIKGMAGQAVQNMNLMFGLDETAGLTQGGLWP